MRECGDCDLAFTRNSVPATPAFKSVSVSRSRHSRYWRSLQDLPIQGTPVILRVHVGRWRCEMPVASGEYARSCA